MLENGVSKKDLILNYILYIYYLIYLEKYSNNIKALIDFGNEVNIMTLVCTFKLGLQV